jgi:hypothetical protein
MSGLTPTITFDSREDATLFLVQRAKGEHDHGKTEFCPFCKAEGQRRHKKGCYLIPIVRVIAQIVD